MKKGLSFWNRSCCFILLMVCQDISPDEEWLVLLKTVVQFYFTYGVSKSLASAFVGVGRIAPDEERFVFWKQSCSFILLMVCQEVFFSFMRTRILKLELDMIRICVVKSYLILIIKVMNCDTSRIIYAYFLIFNKMFPYVFRHILSILH